MIPRFVLAAAIRDLAQPVEVRGMRLRPMEAVLGWVDESGLLHVGRERHPCPALDLTRALVVVDRDEDGSTHLTPFAPPAPPLLAHDVVLLDPKGLLNGGSAPQDCTGELTLRFGTVRLAVVGLLPGGDSGEVWWWTPSGAVLLLRPVVDEPRGRFLLVDRIADPRRRRTIVPPNRLVHFGTDVQVVATSDDELWGAARGVTTFRPPTSPLLDAWRTYEDIERRESASRLAERQRVPLSFHRARPAGRHWLVDVVVDPRELEAWGRPEQGKDRVRVDQAVELEDDDNLRKFTLSQLQLQGGGAAIATLEGVRGSLPERGQLLAIEDRGSRRRKEREELAFHKLLSGTAAVPHLLDLLTRPETARPPAPVRPPYTSPRVPLDDDQRHAVELILGCEDLVVIQGPPGTGKTRVIVEALTELASRRRPGEPMRILVSSVQNEAVANVVQRLAGVVGVQIRLVQRRGATDEERRRFAQARLEGRDRAIERLEERLRGSLIAAQRQAINRAMAELDVLRRRACAGPDAFAALSDDLERLAQGGDWLAPTLRAELPGLLEALRRDGAPTPMEPATTPLPDLPSGPETASSWWEGVREHVGAGSVAEVGALVRRLDEALEGIATNPLRWERRRDRVWSELQEKLGALRIEGGHRAERRGVEPVALLDAWLASAARELRRAADQIAASPEAIAADFLRELQEDAWAWATLLDRYGNTVAATTSKSADARNADDPPFDLAIIDEAGRATPFELLVPLVQARRIVLIGDDRQLPPLVDREIARRAATEGSPLSLEGISIFGRVREALPSANKARLGKQYRMCEHIGTLVSALFYRPHGETLLNGTRDLPGRPGPRPRWGLGRDLAVVWVDVRSSQTRTEQNPEQAAAAAELVGAYLSRPVPPVTIGVVCAYRAQVRRVGKALRDELGSTPEGVKVGTADEVQGREYEVVLFVSSRTDGRPGFLAAPNRVNVALSRAQSQLLILGDHRAFRTPAVRRHAPHLRDLAEWCAEGGAVLTTAQVIGEGP